MTTERNTLAEEILYGRNGTITLATTSEVDDEALGGGGVLATANNIEARVEVQNTQIMLPNDSSTRLRRIGWSGTGSLRIYRHNASFFQIMRQMIDFRSPVPVFDLDMQLVNKDPDAEYQIDESIILNFVKFWTFDWMFNMNDFVELPLTFTFEDIQRVENEDS